MITCRKKAIPDQDRMLYGPLTVNVEMLASNYIWGQLSQFERGKTINPWGRSTGSGLVREAWRFRSYSSWRRNSLARLLSLEPRILVRRLDDGSSSHATKLYLDPGI